MKLSDYVAEFLAKEKVGHVFVITGGAAVNLIDSIAQNKGLEYICTANEQAAAMAADAYSRVSENIGVALATSGPGATNLVTGVCCSYFDSIPTVFITGQVPRSQLREGYNVRQIGFQETDIAELFSSITKYAAIIKNPEDIRKELEKAFNYARSGRPGPVVLDIPDDVQRAQIDPEKLAGFFPEEKYVRDGLEEYVRRCAELIEQAERPVLILGGGIKLARAQASARNLAETLKIPTALTWGLMDLLEDDHPLNIRDFGVAANRAGNFAVQNSDLIVAIGTRLDTHEAGSNFSTFARGAKKIVVDIDGGELEKYEKMGMKVDLLGNYDVTDFMGELLKKKIGTRDLSKWTGKIKEWRNKYPICPASYFMQQDKVNPYVFMDALSKGSKEGDIVITDAGGNLTWTMQGFKVKKGQKLFSAFNHSPMGYSLPASIGAYFASRKPVTCIIGDGGIQMNIQELATIAKHNIPVKIFLINNNGYGIIQQTQDTWLQSRYFAANPESGVAIPDFVKIAEAYGIKTEKIRNHSELEEGIRRTMDYEKGPVLCDVAVEQHAKIMPKLEFGNPIEDSSPLLPREEFLQNMIVEPLKK